MIRIAICDSDVVFSHMVMEVLEQFFRGSKYEIEDFSDGRELLDEIECAKEGPVFQMIILEVALPVFDGICVGRALRRNLRYRDTRLVYISDYDCGAAVITEVHPFAYIPKNLTRRMFKERLESCVADLKKPKRYIAKNKDNAIVFDTGDILYLESVNRSTIIHRKPETAVEITQPLSLVFQELSALDRYFLQTHKSFVVNSRMITAFSRNEVQLCGKLWVPVSHGYRKQLKDVYLELFDTNLS